MHSRKLKEEKIKKKNDVKARGLLLMALPNEHQLTFSQYPDAKSMFAALNQRILSNLIRLIEANGSDVATLFAKLRAKKQYYQRQARRFFIECKEDQFKNQDKHQRSNGIQRCDTSKAMLAIDGVGFDWSDMAEEQVQTNMALMAFSDSEITDKNKKGFGYSAVPPPHPLIYNRPNKLDLSYSGLDEFKEPEFKGYGPENSKKESNVVKESDNSKENSDNKRVSEGEPKKVRENNDAPIIEDWVSDDEEQDESDD
ncbi:hypothetical protein Tco_0409276 [Tanacetum coccineum]